jgi:hypothetical protein
MSAASFFVVNAWARKKGHTEAEAMLMGAIG